jgi:hypothetical protein
VCVRATTSHRYVYAHSLLLQETFLCEETEWESKSHLRSVKLSFQGKGELYPNKICFHSLILELMLAYSALSLLRFVLIT